MRNFFKSLFSGKAKALKPDVIESFVVLERDVEVVFNDNVANQLLSLTFKVRASFPLDFYNVFENGNLKLHHVKKWMKRLNADLLNDWAQNQFFVFNDVSTGIPSPTVVLFSQIKGVKIKNDTEVRVEVNFTKRKIKYFIGKEEVERPYHE